MLLDRLPFPIAVLALVAVAVVGVARAMQGRRGMGPSVVVGAIVWVAATAFLTLRPGSAQRLNLVPFAIGDDWVAYEPLMNVCLFVPLGILLATLGWRWVGVAVAAFAVSFAIEATQYAMDVGRAADVNDLITNTVGGLLGAVVVSTARVLVARPAAAAR